MNRKYSLCTSNEVLVKDMIARGHNMKWVVLGGYAETTKTYTLGEAQKLRDSLIKEAIRFQLLTLYYSQQ